MPDAVIVTHKFAGTLDLGRVRRVPAKECDESAAQIPKEIQDLPYCLPTVNYFMRYCVVVVYLSRLNHKPTIIPNRNTPNQNRRQ